jgi:hypothetical protein
MKNMHVKYNNEVHQKLFKEGGYKKEYRGVNLIKVYVYTYMKISQWNLFVQLIYVNKRDKNDVSSFILYILTICQIWGETWSNSLKCKLAGIKGTRRSLLICSTWLIYLKLHQILQCWCFLMMLFCQENVRLIILSIFLCWL